MAYVKYKEITKYFYFSRYVEKANLPKYINDYVFEDEVILASYKTLRDHGVFTDKKIVLFDTKMSLKNTKEVFTIPYLIISSASIVFKPSGAEMSFLVSGYPLRLKFIKMNDADKARLRVLYNVIERVITKQQLKKEDINRLIENKFNFD
ncbi:MAG TPA: PH domain-containing protein [Bacilli bacterium]|nr:PH domain-containing protein [Bacilli bacterium]